MKLSPEFCTSGLQNTLEHEVKRRLSFTGRCCCVVILYEEALGNKQALPDMVCHSSRTPSKENQPVFSIESVRGKGRSTLVLSIELCFNIFDTTISRGKGLYV